MAKRTIKTWQKLLSKVEAPAGWKAQEWQELRAAHVAGAVLYGAPTVRTFEPKARQWFVLGDASSVQDARHVVKPAGWYLEDGAPEPVTVAAPVVAAPPLQLERGCSRCGEPLAAKRKGDTCAPCAKELRAKGVTVEAAPAEKLRKPITPQICRCVGAILDGHAVCPKCRSVVEPLPVPAAQLAAAEAALRDWDAREAMARTFQPERAEYEKSGAGEERTVICMNPFAALNALEGR